MRVGRPGSSGFSFLQFIASLALPLQAFLEALKQNTTVTVINLHWNGISEEILKQAHSSLWHVWLCPAKLDHEGKPGACVNLGEDRAVSKFKSHSLTACTGCISCISSTCVSQDDFALLHSFSLLQSLYDY